MHGATAELSSRCSWEWCIPPSARTSRAVRQWAARPAGTRCRSAALWPGRCGTAADLELNIYQWQRPAIHNVEVFDLQNNSTAAACSILLRTFNGSHMNANSCVTYGSMRELHCSLHYRMLRWLDYIRYTIHCMHATNTKVMHNMHVCLRVVYWIDLSNDNTFKFCLVLCECDTSEKPTNTKVMLNNKILFGTLSKTFFR